MTEIDEAKPVVELLREYLKLSPRQRWYLAESIANSIGHELVESDDEIFAEELAKYKAFLLPGEAELDEWVKALPRS
jgi:hypothetical protein